MRIIVVNCFDTYEHRVDLLYDTFIRNGCSVKVYTSDFCHIQKVRREESKTGYVFVKAKPYRKNMSIRRIRSHVKFSRDVFLSLESENDSVDLLWILTPPNSLMKEAEKYKKNHPKCKIVFDVIDLWPETMPIGAMKKFPPFFLWKRIRDDSIECADYVVTECKLFRQILDGKVAGKKTSTVYLARPVIPYEPNLHLQNDRICLCYLGSINNIIDIKKISQIILDFRKQKPVELHIVGDGEQKEKLIKQAQMAGAKVVFHGKVYNREEKQRIFDSCHYGLNIMKPSVCVGLTMKSIDYFEFGLPMINNIVGDTWDIINDYNVGENQVPLLDEKVNMQQRENARKFFEKELSLSVFSNKIEGILDDLGVMTK